MPLAGTQYASIEDFLNAGLPTGALASIDKSIWNQALIRASAFADTFIGCKYTLPLGRPYDPSLVDAVCQIAAWRLMSLRGYNPAVSGGSSDALIRQGFLDARQWLYEVSNGRAALTVVQATPESLQPDVYTSTQRGIGDLAGGGTLSNFVSGTDNWGT